VAPWRGPHSWSKTSPIAPASPGRGVTRVRIIAPKARLRVGVATLARNTGVASRDVTPAKAELDRPPASRADRLSGTLVRGGSLGMGRRHKDAVLREPRADGFPPTKRLRIDQEPIRNEDLSPTEADDQDAGPLISA